MSSQKRASVTALFEQGAITEQQIPAALSQLGLKPDKERWLSLFDTLFLWLGSCAIAVSVIFFIAYNWADMSRLGKFTLVEASIVLSVIFYWHFSHAKLIGRLALLVASLLVGALMAFYGQTYQTGADSWQLFFYWALLITPWVFISQFSTLWLLWLMLLNLSIVLYIDTFHSFFWLTFDSESSLFWCLFIFNTLSLVIWELCKQYIVRLTERWPQRVIALIGGWAITSLVIYNTLEKPDNLIVPLLVWFVWIVSFMWGYRRVRVDLFMLAGGCLSLILVTMTLIGRYILETGNEAALLLLSLLIMAMGAGAAYWLKQVHQEIEA